MNNSFGAAYRTSLIALVWLAASVAPANAYNPPQCIGGGRWKFCLASEYNPNFCVHRKFHGQTYIYCRNASGHG
jgi:hypothetical protein